VVPKHIFEISLNQRYRGFVFHLNLNRIGAYLAPVFENNPPFRIAELSFPGYTKVDLFGSYERRLGEDVGAVFFVAAENVLNRSYYENGFRAPGFLARGGIKLKF
jgi:outer membrane receptor protein involved in Fe transport